jgi:uncharacterized protein with HEPN domain
MRDEVEFLSDMLDSALRVQKYVAGKTYSQFLADEVLQDAVLWRLSVIGEAGKKITPAQRGALPDIPFAKITRMRDRLSHVYWRIDYHIVWETATTGIPDLIKHLSALPNGPGSVGGSGTP